MAVIDRWLAAIDHLYASKGHEFASASGRGHESGVFTLANVSWR
jgi:hypothetical protein